MILFVTSIFRAFIEQENIAYLSISLSDIFVFGSFIFIAERIVTYIGRTSIQNSTQEKRKFMISIVGSGLFILLVVFLFHETAYKVSIFIWLLCNIILCTVYMLLNKEYQ